jgi:hypothetical protein
MRVMETKVTFFWYALCLLAAFFCGSFAVSTFFQMLLGVYVGNIVGLLASIVWGDFLMYILDTDMTRNKVLLHLESIKLDEANRKDIDDSVK